MQKDDWSKIELITNAEHHFNNLCFKIRTLASSWLLATMGGVGFLLSRAITLDLHNTQLIVLLCWVGAIGILVLWVLDMLIYQKMLHVWFDSRKEIEERNADFPKIRHNIKKSQPGGRASNLIKLFYLALVALPLALALYISVFLQMHMLWAVSSISMLVASLASIYCRSPSDDHDSEPEV